jgi:hypothetical protein
MKLSASLSSVHFWASPKKFRYFPHNLRKFTASITRAIQTTIWLLLYTIVLANVFSGVLTNHTLEYSIQQAILRTPHSGYLHSLLGNLYLPYNREVALRELLLAQAYTNVLGIQTKELNKPQNITQKGKELEEEALKYERIVQKDPNYYYAQLKLGNVYYSLDKKDQGKLMLIRLEKTIPYDEAVVDLGRLYKGT